MFFKHVLTIKASIDFFEGFIMGRCRRVPSEVSEVDSPRGNRRKPAEEPFYRWRAGNAIRPETFESDPYEQRAPVPRTDIFKLQERARERGHAAALRRQREEILANHPILGGELFFPGEETITRVLLSATDQLLGFQSLLREEQVAAPVVHTTPASAMHRAMLTCPWRFLDTAKLHDDEPPRELFVGAVAAVSAIIKENWRNIHGLLHNLTVYYLFGDNRIPENTAELVVSKSRTIARAQTIAYAANAVDGYPVSLELCMLFGCDPSLPAGVLSDLERVGEIYDLHQLHFLVSKRRDIDFECPGINRTINRIRFRLALEMILSDMDNFGRKELEVGTNLHNRQLLAQLVAFSTYFNLFEVVSSVYTFRCHCVSSHELDKPFQPITVAPHDKEDEQFIATSAISFMLANGLIRVKPRGLSLVSSSCSAYPNLSPPEQYIITDKGMHVLEVLLEKLDLPIE
jgi:hypothetical protein